MPGSRLGARPALVLVALLASPVTSSTAALQSAALVPSKETLTYNIEWRLVEAGKARLTRTASPQASRPGWQVDLHLESAGLVSKLYKVDDEYTANLNSDLCVQNTHLQAHEGGRQRETTVHFDPSAKKASYLERDLIKRNTITLETDIPSCVHDVVGGLLFLRSQNLALGRTIEISVSDGKKAVLAKVEGQQREQVKVPAGTFQTVRYEAFLFNGILYRRPGHLYVWLTDDARKLPVRIQVRLQFTIGTITLQLEKEEKT